MNIALNTPINTVQNSLNTKKSTPVQSNGTQNPSFGAIPDKKVKRGLIFLYEGLPQFPYMVINRVKGGDDVTVCSVDSARKAIKSKKPVPETRASVEEIMKGEIYKPKKKK